MIEKLSELIYYLSSLKSSCEEEWKCRGWKLLILLPHFLSFLPVAFTLKMAFVRLKWWKCSDLKDIKKNFIKSCQEIVSTVESFSFRRQDLKRLYYLTSISTTNSGSWAFMSLESFSLIKWPSYSVLRCGKISLSEGSARRCPDSILNGGWLFALRESCHLIKIQKMFT